MDSEGAFRDIADKLPEYARVNARHYGEFFRRLEKPEHADTKTKLLDAYQVYMQVMREAFYALHPEGARALGLLPPTDAARRC